MENRFIGKYFHNLFVIDYAYNRNTELSSYYVCKCKCGNITEVLGYQLLSGHKRSCGCLARKYSGYSRSTEYRIWAGIIQRCENPKVRNYMDYGGRGIKLCKRWRSNYLAFYKDMGPRPTNRHSIERIDKDGDYEPDNCCWATKIEQNNNTRFNVKFYYRDKYLSISEISRLTNVSREALESRLKKGLYLDDAIKLISEYNQSQLLKVGKHF